MADQVDALCIGETMVALRTRGLLALGAPLTPAVAGAESNVAIALSRLGHHAAWCGVVGADQAGALVVRCATEDELQAHQEMLRLLDKKSGGKTAWRQFEPAPETVA